MTFASGATLGAYSILSKLGEGGMGQVYRARDTRLNRDVAIKVLPDAFAADPDRLARFTREAQALAALNHANIGQIYGIEDSNGQKALIMELVEGDDLSVVIARASGRGLPLDEALPIARQIADALEAAHEQGIVHRDLKPQNVKVRADGVVKVLDFGLAKALDRTQDSGPGTLDPQNSPTLTARATQMGMILGTAAYMSPEQAKGRTVDRRADVWAFGAVLYEMLTGARAFEGEDITEVLASVLRSDPNWSALPADTPASVRRLLKRCLERDVKKRLSAIGDARLDLEDHAEDRPSPTSSGATRPSETPKTSAWHPFVWTLVGVAVAFGAWAMNGLWAGSSVAPGADSATSTVRTSINAPAGEVFFPDSATVSISPDGNNVAFVTGAVAGSGQLWVRPLDALTPRKVSGPEGTALPFWSPDSRRLAFFTNNKLKIVPAEGGPVETIADAPNARGGTWSGSTLLYAPDAVGPIFRVSPGGQPAPLTTLDASKQESGHRFPHFLPDGDHFTYAVVPGREGKFLVYVGSVSHPDVRVSLGAMDTAPIYVAPGYLLFTRSGVVNVMPFDATTLKITGDPVSLSDQPTAVLNPRGSYTAAPLVSASSTGSLLYYSGPSMNAVLEWIGADGQVRGSVSIPPGPIESVRLSPDATQAALVRSNSPSDSTIWIADLVRQSATPLSNGRGRNDDPAWSPDGQSVVFASDRDGAQNFYVKSVSHSTPETLVFKSAFLFKNVADWSPDGKTWLVNQLDKNSAQNIYVMPATGGELTPFIDGPLRDVDGRYSRDGKWVVYTTDESGHYEVMAQSVPPTGRPVRIAPGANGRFSRDGRSIAFVNVDLTEVWRVDVTPGPRLAIGTPRKIATLPADVSAIDSAPDLDRFLVAVPESKGTGAITLVQGWRNALRK